MFNRRGILNILSIHLPNLTGLKYFPRYISDALKWYLLGGKIDNFFPNLADYSDKAGVAKGHYFHQDLLVAQKVFIAQPKLHVDVGSRIDGFVAHVAAFREIKVIDIRDLQPSEHQNITFEKVDLMTSRSSVQADSVSCLHALEHFGLGRYSDPININGHWDGLDNLIKLVAPGGTLYISLPISRNDRVEFNAHRVISPRTLLQRASVKKNLVLQDFDYVDDSGQLVKNANINDLPNLHYGCGIFTFVKNQS